MSSDNIAIRVRNLGRKYKLGEPQEQYHTFRDAIVNSLWHRWKYFSIPPPNEGFWALKDVSFDVEQGGLSASREFPHVDDAALGIILATEH